MSARFLSALLPATIIWTAGWVPASETWSRLPVDGGETAPALLPVEVTPNSPELHYDGRFDRADPLEAVCAWPASAVTVRFRGTAVNVRLGPGANGFVAAVDGVPVKILADNAVDPARPPTPGGLKLYAVAAGLTAGEHRATVFKATEPMVGEATFGGFQLGAGSAVLPAPASRRKLLVIGDSISCGYGNEAASGSERFSPATENAWWTYGAIAARALGADYECIAWSGRKMYPDFTIPEIYDRVLPSRASPRWPGDHPPPDAILINLCTNDLYAERLPDRAEWVRAYRRFVVRLRRDAPGAVIYCALGPMLNNLSPPGRTPLTTAREWIGEVVEECQKAGDAKVHPLEFAVQRAANGVGANNHPSVRTHQIMAEKLTGILRADLGWHTASPEE